MNNRYTNGNDLKETIGQEESIKQLEEAARSMQKKDSHE